MALLKAQIKRVTKNPRARAHTATRRQIVSALVRILRVNLVPSADLFIVMVNNVNWF